ncbi:MAG: hypothetical protein AB1791_09300 [Chloroflexota bacterium]
MNDYKIPAAWRRSRARRGLFILFLYLLRFTDEARRPQRKFRWRLCVPRASAVGSYLLLIALALAWVSPAAAHPMGNYSINRYTRLELAADQITVVYLLDMAELPTFQEKKRMDADDDGAVSPAESQTYLDQQARALSDHLRLEINSQRLDLALQNQFMEFRPGQGGLETLFVRLELTAALPPAADWIAEYSDDNYSDQLGWWEVVTEPQEGVVLLESTAPMVDVSDELSNFPQDLVTFVDDASFHFRAAGSGEPSGMAATPVTPAGASLDAEGDPAGIAAYRPPAAWGVGVIILLALLTVAWGFVHSAPAGLGSPPGRLAIGQGLKTAAAHLRVTFLLSSVLALLWQFVLPNGWQPWLRLAAGLTVLVIGIAGLRKRRVAQSAGLPEVAQSAGLRHKSAAWLVLLGTVALGQVAVGPLLLLAFGLGLLVASAAGWSVQPGGRWWQLVRAAGPLAITLAGAGLTWLTVTQPVILQGLLTFLLWLVGFSV